MDDISYFFEASADEKAYLAKIFKVSNVTVWQALSFKKNNLIHRKIRKAAALRGNKLMISSPAPKAIVLSRNSEDTDKISFYQKFQNGASLEGSLSDGIIALYDDQGDLIKVWSDPKVSDLSKIQDYAANLKLHTNDLR